VKIFKSFFCPPLQMAEELCVVCRTITLSMFLQGFQHPLDYNQILLSQNGCQLCALMISSYDTQRCAPYPKKECDKIHRGRLIWTTTTGVKPDIRYGMFKLDAYHFGTPFQVCTSEGIANFSLYAVQLPRASILTPIRNRFRLIPERYPHTKGDTSCRFTTQYSAALQMA
jgi:hypothetical protein